MMTSQVIRKLAVRELVARAEADQDARARLLQITPAGIACATAAIRDVETTDTMFFEQVPSPSPRDALLDALRILAGLDSQSDENTQGSRSR